MKQVFLGMWLSLWRMNAQLETAQDHGNTLKKGKSGVERQPTNRNGPSLNTNTGQGYGVPSGTLSHLVL